MVGGSGGRASFLATFPHLPLKPTLDQPLAPAQSLTENKLEQCPNAHTLVLTYLAGAYAFPSHQDRIMDDGTVGCNKQDLVLR